MIRVFARKTKWTPTDELVFFDGPPLYVLPNVPVFVSVTFTWDIERAERLALAWDNRAAPVYMGGPAFDRFPPREFVPGRFIKKGVTITSRGCPKKCPWCLVPQREGALREINIAPGYIVQDNNLLACSEEHIEGVFQMLSEQKKAAQFKGGLDIDYLNGWHIDLLKRIRIAKVGLCVSCDCKGDLARLDKAKDMLSDFSIEKKRCYVLVGFDGDTQEQAQERLVSRSA